MKVNSRTLNKIIDKNFTWEDVSSYKTSFNGNVFCFHHQNTNTPAAKLYYDSEDDWWVLYCYSERRCFHVHDYIQTVLIEERQLYTSLLDFLRQHMPEGEILSQYKIFEKNEVEFIETSFAKKKQYIDNMFVEVNENTVEYIEALYCA